MSVVQAQVLNPSVEESKSSIELSKNDLLQNINDELVKLNVFKIVDSKSMLTAIEWARFYNVIHKPNSKDNEGLRLIKEMRSAFPQNGVVSGMAGEINLFDRSELEQLKYSIENNADVDVAELSYVWKSLNGSEFTYEVFASLKIFIYLTRIAK